MEPTLKTNTYERGTYYFFDCLNWRKVAKVKVLALVSASLTHSIHLISATCVFRFPKVCVGLKLVI